MKCCTIIPAGGVGKRFGSEIPKQYVEIDSVPVIIHTLRLFEKIDDVEAVVLVVHNEWYTFTKELIKKFNITKVSEVVIGGLERQDSVNHGIRTKSAEQSEIILVHDAVRPFATTDLVQRVIDNAEEVGAVIPAVYPRETVKEITKKGTVVKTLDRSKLALAQTPQGFWQDIILNAYSQASNAGFVGTDSASLVEFIGYRVTVIEGEDTNIKITNPFDLEVGNMIYNQRKV
ncbi:MAG: 2-C-methyl-D-erythritol 4-phosphate cytidylyltransferase [Candidatus Kapabacteria bacterium]|nr:2-C-methyl-D-erythritol 4-phosphate cytidylyltransferase [Ignavibacteriota bacterium]MCW5886282.1 2-C-methyl-D-erythritol 4-phosphate cytidylyltransferase [Candidatus Kapabacteria bacterium]